MKTLMLGIFVLWSASPAAQTVEFADSSATIRDLKTAQTVKSADTKSLKIENPSLIEAPDQLPILVLPLSFGATLSVPSLPTDALWARGQKGFRGELDSALIEILAIQEQVRRNEFENAKVSIAQFNEKYPDSAVGQWLESNILVVRGRKGEALEKLKQILVKRPDFAPAAKLLSQLKQKGDQ